MQISLSSVHKPNAMFGSWGNMEMLLKAPFTTWKTRRSFRTIPNFHFVPLFPQFLNSQTKLKIQKPAKSNFKKHNTEQTNHYNRRSKIKLRTN